MSCVDLKFLVRPGFISVIVCAPRFLEVATAGKLLRLTFFKKFSNSIDDFAVRSVGNSFLDASSCVDSPLPSERLLLAVMNLNYERSLRSLPSEPRLAKGLSKCCFLRLVGESRCQLSGVFRVSCIIINDSIAFCSVSWSG
jgi:hypothetical protein